VGGHNRRPTLPHTPFNIFSYNIKCPTTLVTQHARIPATQARESKNSLSTANLPPRPPHPARCWATMGDIGGRPDDCTFRVLTATTSSAVMGAVMGAVSSTWTVRVSARAATVRLRPRPRTLRAAIAHAGGLEQDVPKVLKGKALPALLATGRVMGGHSVTFAAIGGIFAAVDVRAARWPGWLCKNPSETAPPQGPFLTRSRLAVPG